MEWQIYSSILQCSTLLKPSLHHFVFCSRTVASLSYKIIGESSAAPDGPPIFLIHGLLGAKKHWERFGKTILNVTKRSVIAVDLRNHGSSPHVNSHKYEELAADVLQLFEKLKIENASLIGHSMGGRTSMCVSLMAPQKVANLLVVDISPVSTSPQFIDQFPKILAAMKAVEFKRPKKVSKAKKEAKRQLKTAVTDEDVMKAVLSNISVKPDGTIGWKLNLDILIKHFKYISSFPKSLKAKKYPGPTLFIGGQMSEFIPPDDLPGIRELFPQAVITYVPKAGHNVHVDDPKAFLELVINFLKANR